jgi:hypothetical protein
VSSALPQIAQIAAPCAAIASAIAASLARATVERANRPFVASNVDPHPSAEPGSDHPHQARVSLHSIGPGIALNVCCSLRVAWDFEDSPAERKRHDARRATEVIDAFPPGETRTMLVNTPPDTHYDEPWWIVVRWSDSAQRRWERTHEHSDQVLAAPAHRIRGQRLARRLARRPWHWWWWSILRRPYTVPPRIKARQKRQW